jgi:hypothetical protein
LGAIGVSSASALGGPNKSCGTISAATWRTGGKTGTTWVVTAAPSTPCSLAKKDGAPLTHQHVNIVGQFKSEPSGWYCSGKPVGGAPLLIACVPHSGRGGFDVTASGYRF